MLNQVELLRMARQGLVAARRQTAESMANSSALAPALARRFTEQQTAIEALDRALQEEERIAGVSRAASPAAPAAGTQSAAIPVGLRADSQPRRVAASLQLHQGTYGAAVIVK